MTPTFSPAQALRWAARFPYCAYYVPAVGTAAPGGAFAHLLAVGTAAIPGPDSLAGLDAWLAAQADAAAPRCGLLTYDLKNEVEPLLHSRHPDGLHWPALHFFVPDKWLRWHPDGRLETHGLTADDLHTIEATPTAAAPTAPVPALRPRLPRAEYLRAVEAVREDILNGEVYELNLCQEFFAEGVQLEPVDTFLKLLDASPTPFAGFYKWQDRFLLCASPERFLRRDGEQLLSQPIKGTSRRGATPEEDEQQRHALLHDEKERAENLMIVDLVRNDLARVSRPGTVQVPELFGLYPFRHVWQMISTVTSQPAPGTTLADTLRATFPMGSMTGAPKVRAMQLIEQYERARRGLYSGSIGYTWPGGDFDFNVVIRSLQYRQDTGYLSFQVGSAITYDSVPEREYEECLLKAKALLEVLDSEIVEWSNG
ncbi:anthranilate synthase component I family protein [Hymenobacter jeollabukensis]|uniref:Anthranilate synthase component I family protein n=1 Tax=Hymenobacter jeollabukensis TaxID=2025313 RepID=A0A5R8WQ34_9BACT|nr:anthranilate synthase component I family protein [Hymenobacter jeollabukensis]TLM91811.1 anthranilate synthase component I family protein [Hymenobacter jeollabukensis]